MIQECFYTMELTRKQFDILAAFAASKEKLSQRQLEEKCGYSLGTVNKVVKEMTELGYVCDGEITPLGIDALEPYRAKKAIFIAAGFGSRMVPVTLNTPKPLIRVNGKRIIDTLIDACLEAGISEIYIVRGYLAEQFDQLLYKYPMIKFLENPSYNEANNISSAMVARYMLQNAYVFESDLIISNPSIIKKYHYNSDVLGIWKDRTDDWVVEVDKDGFITLTDKGRARAQKVLERHQILTAFFCSIGVDADTADDDACRIEHVISDASFEKIKAFLQKS
jgi:CTP:phosphocholine cytidylyltransferase-like protein